MRQRAALLCLFLLGFSVDAIAQATGTVSGRVLDQSGRVLPGVAIDLVVSSRELTTSTAQLDARPVMRAGDVLETVPGMVVSQPSGEGKANQYYVRGFNLDHGTDFSMTDAGVPVNTPTGAHAHGDADLSSLIPELVSGVQFKKGPYVPIDAVSRQREFAAIITTGDCPSCPRIHAGNALLIATLLDHLNCGSPQQVLSFNVGHRAAPNCFIISTEQRTATRPRAAQRCAWRST